MAVCRGTRACLRGAFHHRLLTRTVARRAQPSNKQTRPRDMPRVSERRLRPRNALHLSLSQRRRVPRAQRVPGRSPRLLAERVGGDSASMILASQKKETDMPRSWAINSKFNARNFRRVLSMVALSAVMGFGLASCGKGSKGGGSGAVDTSALNADTANSMLLAYSLQNCRMDLYQYDAAAALPVVDAWEQQLPSKGYASQSMGAPGQVPTIDVYAYNYQGVPMTIKVSKFPIFGGSRSIAGCLWVPSSITVLDTTIDPTGKAATVIFRYGPKVKTPFAADMYALAPTPSNDEQADELSDAWTTEHRAFFQKLDASGWRVNSVN
jgi:hypothetical protein